MTYQSGSTSVEDDASTVLRQRSGVCQDFAHLTIALSRAAGVPARYVSGYVKPPGGDGVASHAWAELYLPGPGWVGLDTSGPGPIGERYVRLAYGRDYADANPVRGTFSGGGRQDLRVDVRVQQVQQQQQ
jgi:transglutaminase-like putative cysteine protease